MILRSRMLILAATLPFVAGCGAYLHDAGLETSTSELKTSYEGLQAPAMMAELKASETQFAADEDRAALEAGIAARNAALTGFIRAPSRRAPQASCEPIENRSPINTRLLPCVAPGIPAFEEIMRSELGRVYGEVSDDRTLNDIATAPETLATAVRRTIALSGQVVERRAEFIQARDAAMTRASDAERAFFRIQHPTDCDAVPAPPTTPPDGLVELRYFALQNDCEALRINTPSGPIARAANGSQLAGLREEMRQSRARRERAQTSARDLAAAIEALKEKATDPGSLTSLNQDIQRVQQLLEAAQPAVRVAGLEELSTLIDDLLAAELHSEEAGVRSETTARGAVGLQVLRATAGAADAFAAQPRVDRTNALLLGAAQARHALRMAQLDVAREEAESRIMEARALALTIKAAHYARAVLILRQGRLHGAADFAAARRDPNLRGAAGEVLAAYVGAWNYGEIPDRTLQLKQIQVRRATAIDRATLTEADYRTSLKPVFDQLAAYGAGGVRPEVIAELLGQLGIAGAIFRE